MIAGVQAQFADFTWSTMPGRSANCGKRKYVASASATSVMIVFRLGSLEGNELEFLDTALLHHLGIAVPSGGRHVPLSAVWVAPLKALDCSRGSASPHSIGAEYIDGRTHGPFGPDDDGERRQHLGHVGIENRLVDGHFGEPEVDHPWCSVVFDKDVGTTQVAVRDAVLAQHADLLPRRPHQLIGHRLIGDTVEGVTADHLVGEQHRIAADIDDAAQSRGTHADVAGDQCDQCFVFDRSSQRRERPIVADVLESQKAVGAKQQIRSTLLRSQDLDEDTGAVGKCAEVGRRAPRIDLGRMDFTRWEPGRDERSTDCVDRRTAGQVGRGRTG